MNEQPSPFPMLDELDNLVGVIEDAIRRAEAIIGDPALAAELNVLAQRVVDDKNSGALEYFDDAMGTVAHMAGLSNFEEYVSDSYFDETTGVAYELLDGELELKLEEVRDEIE